MAMRATEARNVSMETMAAGVAAFTISKARRTRSVSSASEEADLGDILTYGFRGEALASIAAVAEVTLKTRRAQDDTATQVKTGGGSDLRSSSVAAPVGSSFAVRNLFFNTPARRKFLKSDNVAVSYTHLTLPTIA